MTSFGYPKQKQKKIKICMPTFLKLKVHLDPIARWKGLDKILMYIKYITYIFSMVIGPHVYDSWTLPNKRKINK